MADSGMAKPPEISKTQSARCPNRPNGTWPYSYCCSRPLAVHSTALCRMQRCNRNSGSGFSIWPSGWCEYWPSGKQYRNRRTVQPPLFGPSPSTRESTLDKRGHWLSSSWSSPPGIELWQSCGGQPPISSRAHQNVPSVSAEVGAKNSVVPLSGREVEVSIPALYSLSNRECGDWKSLQSCPHIVWNSASLHWMLAS